MKKQVALFCALFLLFSGINVFAQAVSVSQAQGFANKASVVLRGNIIQAISHDRYIFRDASGDIIIKIKQDRWLGLTVGPADRVEIGGELKRDKNNRAVVHVDVKQIRRATSEPNNNDIQNHIRAVPVVFVPPGTAGRGLFAYPLRGRLTSPFGWRNDPISGARRFHNGIDLAANVGTAVRAAMDGRVSVVGTDAVYGRYVILTHNNGYQTLYAHLSRFSVSQGANVTQGTKIGESGNSGYSTGPHLHFAIYRNGQALNPLDVLN
jgi:uncharacterized protein (TIGR00156 family)